MTNQILSIISTLGTVALAVVPSWQLITNKNEKGLKRITPLGWILLTVAIITAFCSVFFIRASFDKPLLNIHEDAKVIKSYPDSAQIALSIINTEKGVAKNIKTKVVSVNSLNNTFFITKDLPEDYNESIFIQSQGLYSYYLNVLKPTIKFDNTYVYFKVSYTDEDGKEQPPLRKIYPIPNLEQGTLIYDAHEAEYDSVKNILIKNNIW